MIKNIGTYLIAFANQNVYIMKKNAAFAKVDFAKVLNPKAYVGRAPQQVDEFVTEEVTPVRRKYRKQLQRTVDLKV